jgi:DNA-binding beta-propeller fold protein YncE
MHGIAYDDVQDVIVVPAQLSQAVLSFRGDAKGEEHPVRVIQGPHTQIQQADRVAVDSLHEEIFVGDSGQVLVFPANANGDVTPIRAIRGPDTQLSGRGGVPPIAVDPVNNVLIVASTDILIFDRAANGNAKPLRVITGNGAGGRLAAASNGLIFAASSGVLGVWSVNDNGPVAPRFRIGAGVLQDMRGVAIDAKNQDVIITDKELNAILTYHVPEVFAGESSR